MGTDVQDLTARAKKLISERRYPEAVRVCRRVLLSRPDEVDVRLLLGIALLALRRYDEVRVEMMALARKVPNSVAVHRLLGEAYLRSGQPERAKQSLQKVLALKPGDSIAAELLREVDSEDAPASQTIDRWFDPEAIATIEASTPYAGDAAAVAAVAGLDEEEETEQLTGVAALVAARHAAAGMDSQRQKDAAEWDTTSTDTGAVEIPAEAIPPRMRRATISGVGGPAGAPGPAPVPASTTSVTAKAALPDPGPTRVETGSSQQTAARGGPPRKATMMGMGMQAAVGRAQKPSSIPPPPDSVPPQPGTAGPPRQTPFPPPSAPVRMTPHAPLPAEETAAERPTGRRGLRGEPISGTQELQVDDIEEVDRPAVIRMPRAHGLEQFRDFDDLESEATEAQTPRSEQDLEELATRAMAVDDGYAPIEAEPTVARAPDEEELTRLRSGAYDEGDFDDPYDPLEAEPTRARPSPMDMRGYAPPAAPDPLEFMPTAGRGVDPLDYVPTVSSKPSDMMAEEARARRRTGEAAVLPPQAPYPQPYDPFAPPAARDPFADARGGRGAPPPGPAPAPPGGPPMAYPQGRGPGPAPHRGPPVHPVPTPSQPAAPVATPTRSAPSRGPNKIVVMAAAAVLLVVAAAGVTGIVVWLGRRGDVEVAEAIRAASDEGTKQSLDRALGLAEEEGDDDPDAVARLAVLHAIAALEHGSPPDARRATELLGALGAEAAGLTDARIANAYLKLAEGNVTAARDAASGADPNGESGAEASRARALAAAAAGEMDDALAEARHAVQLRPDAPRHVALFALMSGLQGDAAGAISALDRVPNGARSPAIRLTRARVLQESGRDPAGAATEAGVVLGELAASATPGQKGWAHLVRARQAATSGSTNEALREARSAAQLRPPADEAFVLSLVEVLLKTGAPQLAREQLRHLPNPVVDTRRAARLRADVALATGDLDGAERALADAGEGPAVEFLRGRLHEARGDRDSARAFYERAAEDPAEYVRARVRLGALEIAEGKPREAIQRMEPAVQRAPGDLELVLLLVRAHLAAGSADRAEEIVRQAESQRPNSPELAMAKAQIALGQGQVRRALAALTELAQQRPEDVEVLVALADAARRSGNSDAARDAYERLLRVNASHSGALIGLVELAVDSGDVAAADAAITRAREGGIPDADLGAARARLLVFQGAGNAAVEALQQAANQIDTAAIWSALGRALLQAERDDEANRAFRRALRLDPSDVEAHLGTALYYTRLGSLGRADRSIDAAERAARGSSNREIEARILVARGRIRFENGDFGDAKRLARQAIQKDARTSDAHLLLANVALEEGEDPIPHLRRAAEGKAPLPEVLGRLATRVRGNEACDLARRYMSAAPEGYDSPDVQRVLARCR